MDTNNFKTISDFSYITSSTYGFPTVTFLYKKKHYTLMPCRNTHNSKVSYWLSCQGYTFALYTFSALTLAEVRDMLRDESTILSFVSMFGGEVLKRSGKPTPLQFVDGKDMLKSIEDFGGLYNPNIETYVFFYNDCGSIAVYTGIDTAKATKLAADAKDADEYWGTFLGAGGHIYDDPSHPEYDEERATNLEFCNRYFNNGRWYAENDWVSAD